jgi:SpoVK/Ycf46/Vps4 family AAA+-type ATPase
MSAKKEAVKDAKVSLKPERANISSPIVEAVFDSIRCRSRILYVVTQEEERFLKEMHTVLFDTAHRFNRDAVNEMWLWTAGNGLREVTHHYAFMPYRVDIDAEMLRFPRYSQKEQETMQNTVMASPAMDHIAKTLCVPPRPTTTDGYPPIVNRIIILADYNRIAQHDLTSVRKIKDLIEDPVVSESINLTFIILASQLEIPAEIKPFVEVIDYHLPDRKTIHNIVREQVDQFHQDRIEQEKAGVKLDIKTEYTDEETKAITDSLLGLTHYEISVQIPKSIRKCRQLDPAFLIEAKEQIVRKSDIINYMHPTTGMKSIGGMENFKAWCVDRKNSFGDDAKAFGLEPPKGVLLLGIPGTGKSLAAKSLGNDWRVPLLHLDVGKIMSGIVGSSEARMRQALQTAESVAPCILWVDEIEKGLSGTGSSNFSDGGTMARVFGTFLTWMQEKTADVFVIATANNISQLPPELLRKGRFDEIFFIDLPGDDERKEIYTIHLTRRRGDPKNFDLDLLSKESKGFSGAEIEHTVKDAMYAAFNTPEKKLTTNLVLREIKKTIPLSESMKDEIAHVKTIASRMRFASDKSLNADLNPRTEMHAAPRTRSDIAQLVDEEEPKTLE